LKFGHHRGVRLLVLLSAVLLPLACSYADGEPPRAGECAAMGVVQVFPAPNEQRAPVNVAPTVEFSDFPDPDTIGTETFLLFSSVFRYVGRYRVDLLDRQVSLVPSGFLQNGTGHSIVLRAGVRSLRGCQLPQTAGPNGTLVNEHYYRFRTVEPGEKPTAPSPVDPPPPPLAAVLDVFARGCAGGACHLAELPGAGEPGDLATACLNRPAGGLSLCRRDARGSLVDVPAMQVVRLARVVPHDSSRSYLVRKLLGAPPLAGHTLPADSPLSYTDMRTLSLWIDAGAPGE
jgi:hypothetical protein